MSASEITRSMEATGAEAAARVAQRRRAMPNGWWGMLLALATEMTLFASLIASYFYLRFQNSTWPPAGVEDPSVTLPSVFTAILLLTCIPMVGAFLAARAGRRWRAWWLVALAFAVQAAYLGLQLWLYVDDYRSFGPSISHTAYSSIYFALLGIHHFHVAVGLALDAWLLLALALGLTNYRLIATRVIALYWLFVAAIAVPVLITQLYPSL